jgi:S1-C subfamily serine protease
MPENESDSGDGSQQPPGYANPWAPRDQGESPWAPASDANAAPPPDDDPGDTIAFGMPPRQASGYGQGSAGQPYGSQSQHESQSGWWDRPGYGDQAAYGDQPAYGSPPRYGDQPGYGQASSGGVGGTEGSAGYGDSGQGPSGWALPGSTPPERPRRGGHFVVYLAVAALAASVGAGVTVALDGQNTQSAAGISASDVPGPHANASGSGSSASTLNSTAVEKKVEPGLVDITSTLRYQSETAEGTGMILSASGLVLTNNHVIDGSTAVTASLADNPRRQYRARVVGYNPTDDVALLQLVGASGLTTVSFGDSAQVTLGTPVLALGNAEGRGGVTPARGILNALNRSIQASDEGSGSTEYLNHMLQTDAAIQQGDSGGALANNAGQVIGMITAANTSTSSQSGPPGGTLGFAIPINSALSIAQQIAAGKSSATVYIGLPGFLGVEVAQSSSANPRQQAAAEEQSGSGPAPGGRQGACQQSNQQLSVPARIAPAGSGALILGVLCGTAANTVDLAAGDVILSVNGQAVTTPDSLTAITARYHAGAIVAVSWEGLAGAKHTTSVKLSTGPAR